MAANMPDTQVAEEAWTTVEFMGDKEFKAFMEEVKKNAPSFSRIFDDEIEKVRRFLRGLRRMQEIKAAANNVGQIEKDIADFLERLNDSIAKERDAAMGAYPTLPRPVKRQFTEMAGADGDVIRIGTVPAICRTNELGQIRAQRVGHRAGVVGPWVRGYVWSIPISHGYHYVPLYGVAENGFPHELLRACACHPEIFREYRV